MKMSTSLGFCPQTQEAPFSKGEQQPPLVRTLAKDADSHGPCHGSSLEGILVVGHFRPQTQRVSFSKGFSLTSPGLTTISQDTSVVIFDYNRFRQSQYCTPNILGSPCHNPDSALSQPLNLCHEQLQLQAPPKPPLDQPNPDID